MNIKKKIYLMSVLFIGAFIFLTSCGSDENDSGEVVSTPGIEYHNVDACLVTEDGNVTNCDAVKASEAAGDKSPVAAQADLGTNKLFYLARVLPVQVDGEYVQSNMVLLSKDGKKAFIAYNTAGDVFRGAIQIVDVYFSGLLLGISSEIKFSDMDINSIYLDGDTLFFGASQNPDSNADFAMTFVGHININNPESLETIRANMTRMNLNQDLYALSERGSYAVTGITATDGYYFISVGAYPGGILKVSKTLVDGKLDIANAVFTSYTDIRSIVGYSTNIYALQGTDMGSGTPLANGNIIYNSQDGASWTPLAISNFGSPEHKATIDLFKDPLKSENGLFFLGLSEGGLQVMSMDHSNGRPGDTINVNIPNPAINTALYPDLVADTNSASYDSDLIFSANGNYGFRVLKNNNTGNNRITSPDFQVVGYHNMQGLTYGGVEYSANDAAYRNKVLLVAAGQGGVCVYLLLNK